MSLANETTISTLSQLTIDFDQVSTRERESQCIGGTFDAESFFDSMCHVSLFVVVVVSSWPSVFVDVDVSHLTRCLC